MHGDDFRAGCHAVKGVASAMGAVGLAQAASDAMRLPSERLPNEWRERVRLLRQLLETTLVALRRRGLRYEGDPEP